MRTFLAFLLLVVFSMLTVAGSFLIASCPLCVTYYQRSTANRLPGSSLALIMVVAAALFVAAYGGFYLLIKYHANQYLTRKIGYGKIVTLGFVLQLVVGLLFCIAAFGGTQGSLTANIVVILLLCLPIIVRKLIQLTARDRSYDNFLQENPQDQ
jgi:hypothetical protein